MDDRSAPTAAPARKEAEAYEILLMQEVEMEEKYENLISGHKLYLFVWYRMLRPMFVLTFTNISNNSGVRMR